MTLGDVFTRGQVTKTAHNRRETIILLEGIMTFIYCLIHGFVGWRFSRPRPNVKFSVAHLNHHHHIDPTSFSCNHLVATREGVT